MKRRGFIVQFLMGFVIFTGIAILAGSAADQMYLKNAYFDIKNLTDKAALAAAKKYQETFDEATAIASARAISSDNKIFGQDLKDELVFSFDEANTKVTATLPHFAFETFWLRILGINTLNIDDVNSTATIFQRLEGEKIAPFLINNQGLSPGDSISLTFDGAGVKGADYDPNDMGKFYPIELERSAYYNLDGSVNEPSGGSVEKVARYTSNIIFGSEEVSSVGDIAFLENDNNPAFGNVNSLLNGLDNGFPNFFNNDSVYAATYVALAALKLRDSGVTTEALLASALNQILSGLEGKNDWPNAYVTQPLDSKPELYIAVSNGSKLTEGQSTSTVIEEIIKVRLDSLEVNKEENKHSSPATVKANFVVVYTPPRLID